MDSPTDERSVHRTLLYTNLRTGIVLSNPDTNQKKMKTAQMGSLHFLVGVSGFEPEASWTRTKRDTKLRHTPIAQILY